MTDRSGKMEHISAIVKRILPLKLTGLKESSIDIRPEYLVRIPFLGRCT